MNRKMEKRLSEIERWEHEYFPVEMADLTTSYHLWYDRVMNQINETKRRKWLAKMDNLLFHLQAWHAQTRSYDETNRRLIQYARLFDEEINQIDDLRTLSLEQADYLAEQFMAKQRLLAFGQGGLTGMGGFFLLTLDLPAMALIQLRSLQQLSLIYGYDSRHPIEMMYMLKLFHLATLPKAFQKERWDELFAELNEQQDDVFYQGEEAIFQEEWLEQLLSQLAKGFMITMLRKKMIQGVPLVGMAFGAGVNYRFSQQVIEIGQHFYQKRRVLE